MKKTVKIAILGISLAAFTTLFSSCGQSYNTIRKMQKLEEGVDSPTTKEELKEAIAKYDKRAIDLATTQAQEGVWWKILGTRYLDEQEYGKAYECFQQAVEIYPNNANLYFYLAVCAGYISHAKEDWNATADGTAAVMKQRYLRTSETAYLRAIAINPNYYRALYGLGVLYVFELNESEKAIPYLEQYMNAQVKDTDGMFVLARAYYDNLEFDKAVALYDRIIEINPNADKVAQAEANKKKVLDAQYSN